MLMLILENFCCVVVSKMQSDSQTDEREIPVIVFIQDVSTGHVLTPDKPLYHELAAHWA